MLMTSASRIRLSPSRCFFPNAPCPTTQIIIALTLSLSAAGQKGKRNADQSPLDQLQQPAQKQQQQIIRVENKDEGDAYNTLVKEQDPAKKVLMAEEFISKFPNSDLIQTAQ